MQVKKQQCDFMSAAYVWTGPMPLQWKMKRTIDNEENMQDKCLQSRFHPMQHADILNWLNISYKKTHNNEEHSAEIYLQET